MTNNTAPRLGRWRRFGKGMLCALLIAVVWIALCVCACIRFTWPFHMELDRTEILKICVLGFLAQGLMWLMLARRNTAWWSAGAVLAMLLGLACPLAVLWLAASGMPAMRY